MASCATLQAGDHRVSEPQLPASPAPMIARAY